jgi:cyclophilin family peptidyl-prolyl cis-trans isomerase
MKSWPFAVCAALLLLSLLPSRADTLARFHTAFGDMDVELYNQDKPVTVQNFINYVKSGRYQNGFAHRLLPGFVIQGGGFTMSSRGTTNLTVLDVPTYPPITNEFAVGRRFSNVYGTIAMAKVAGDTNSASSQWFINLADNTFLDAADTNDLFVVFGKVVSGTNVLNIFNNFQAWTGSQSNNMVFDQIFDPPFDDLPLLYPSFVSTNFVFVDISFMQVAVRPVAGGGKEVSWNSATGATNVVEFATNLPPVWNTLATTNGTGARFAVVDTAATTKRFYRVRAAY